MSGIIVILLDAETGSKEKQKKKTGGLKDLLIKHDVSALIGDMYSTKERIKQEIDTYLGTPDTSDIEQGLANFPNVRQLFLMYNCIRSSEFESVKFERIKFKYLFFDKIL